MSKVYNRFAQLEAQREHALHQQRLRKIKPSLKVEAPVSMEFQHMKVNAKKKMMTEERQERIVGDNLKLVKTLETIMARNSRSDGSDPAYVQMEAFARVRQRKMDAIHQENMEILKRIEHCKPVISAQKLLEEAEVQEEQAQRISKAAVLFPAPRKAEKRTKPGHVGGSDGRSPTDGSLPEIYPESSKVPAQRLHQPPVASAKLAGRPTVPKAAASVHSSSHVDVVKAAVQSLSPVVSKSQSDLPPAKGKPSVSPPVAAKPAAAASLEPTRTLALLSSAVVPRNDEPAQTAVAIPPPVSVPNVVLIPKAPTEASPSTNTVKDEQDEDEYCDDYGEDEFPAASPAKAAKPAPVTTPANQDTAPIETREDGKEADAYGDDYGEDEFAATSPSVAVHPSAPTAPPPAVVETVSRRDVSPETEAKEEDDDEYGDDNSFAPSSPDIKTATVQSHGGGEVDYSAEFYDGAAEAQEDDYGDDAEFEE